ncbi:hypothetical protein [Streptomyces sp. NPDC004976]
MTAQFDFLSFVELHSHLRVPADRLRFAAYGIPKVIASVAQHSYLTVGQQKRSASRE